MLRSARPTCSSRWKTSSSSALTSGSPVMRRQKQRHRPCRCGRQSARPPARQAVQILFAPRHRPALRRCPGAQSGRAGKSGRRCPHRAKVQSVPAARRKGRWRRRRADCGCRPVERVLSRRTGPVQKNGSAVDAQDFAEKRKELVQHRLGIQRVGEDGRKIAQHIERRRGIAWSRMGTVRADGRNEFCGGAVDGAH